MTTPVPLPAEVRQALLQIALERGYPEAVAILRRSAETLNLSSDREAQVIVDVARVAVLDAGLRYPHRDEDSARHVPAHEDAFQEVQMGVFEKTVSYVGSVFRVVAAV